MTLALRLPAVPVLAALLWLPADAARGQEPVEHPKLVSAETAECTFCHEEIVPEAAAAHAPVEDDCTICHEMTVAEEGTTVQLMDAEPELCLLCHDEKTAAVEADLEFPHFPATDSCLNCHDPHASEHPQLLTARTAELCGDCHDVEDLGGTHGGQLTAATDCAVCHQPHGSDNAALLAASRKHEPFESGSCKGCHREPFGDRVRLRSRGERLCMACHGDVTEEAGETGSVHAPVHGERGRAGCLSCHDPHMSDNPSLLLAAGTGLCGECHGEILAAAEAETGHFAAADDCTNCHRPHASEQPHLLLGPADGLCADCHDLEDQDLSAAHLGADLGRLACTGCHTPHGAGHPSLLAENLHPPVEDGCDTCHEGSYRELMEGGGTPLCVFCHDDVQAAAAEAAFPHEALELGDCTDCHNPHASPQEHLVKGPGAGPCADCHDEQIAGEGEVAHGVIELLGCRACHEPHGGGREKLLRRAGSELCLSCHDPATMDLPRDAESYSLLGRFEVPGRTARAAAVLRLSPDKQRGHPVTGHRVLGEPTAEELAETETTFEGTLTCLSCHDPHKGRSDMLLWDATAAAEACIACHPK